MLHDTMSRPVNINLKNIGEIGDIIGSLIKNSKQLGQQQPQANGDKRKKEQSDADKKEARKAALNERLKRRVEREEAADACRPSTSQLPRADSMGQQEDTSVDITLMQQTANSTVEVQLLTTHPHAFESINIDATPQCETVSEQPVPTSSRRASSIESEGGYSAAYPPIPITLGTCDVEECTVHCHLMSTAALTRGRFDAIIPISIRDACARRFGDCVSHARIVLTHKTHLLYADLCIPIDRRVSVKLIQSIVAASNRVVSVVVNIKRPSAHSQKSVVQRILYNAKQRCTRTTGASIATGCSIDVVLGKPVPRLDAHFVQLIRSQHRNTTCNRSIRRNY